MHCFLNVKDYRVIVKPNYFDAHNMDIQRQSSIEIPLHLN